MNWQRGTLAGLAIAVTGIALLIVFRMSPRGRISKTSTEPVPQCAHWAILRSCQLLGVAVRMEELIRALPPCKKGHSMLQMIAVLETNGLQTVASRESWDSLGNEACPCIVHLTNPDHFMVIPCFDSTKEFVHVYDGKGMRTRYSRSYFENRWTGAVLSISRANELSSESGERPGGNSPGIPCARFEHLLLDKGDVPATGEPVKFVFPVRNVGTRELVITGVRTRCACLGVEKPRASIPPRGEDAITLLYRVEPRTGVFAHNALVETNDPKVSLIVLVATGFAGVEVQISPQRLRLDRLYHGRQCNTRCFLSYTGAWDDFDVKVDGSSLRGVRLRDYSCQSVGDKCPEGTTPGRAQYRQTSETVKILEFTFDPLGNLHDKIDGEVAITTNVAGYERLSLKISGTIESPVKAYPDTLVFGEIRPDASLQSSITVTSLVNESFRITSVNTFSETIECEYPRTLIKDKGTLHFRTNAHGALAMNGGKILITIVLESSRQRLILPIDVVAWGVHESE